MIVEKVPKAYTLQERAGKPGGGKGPLITEDKCGCLSTSCGNDRCLFQPIGVDLYNQTTTGGVSKTLTSLRSDSDHIPVVIDAVPIEGNGARPSHKGNGYGGAGDNMFTLNTTEVHGIAYSVDMGGVNRCAEFTKKNPLR